MIPSSTSRGASAPPLAIVFAYAARSAPYEPAVLLLVTLPSSESPNVVAAAAPTDSPSGDYLGRPGQGRVPPPPDVKQALDTGRRT